MNEKYTMSLSMNVLNHLGINLYSNIPAVLSEIVANAWDADATKVNITIENDTIVIEDNGSGMSTDDINNKYLCVGYIKRKESLYSPVFQRKYMGRKGIGKLSMFSIAREVTVFSKKELNDKSEINGLKMDIGEITKTIEQQSNNADFSVQYHPEELDVIENEIEKTGTKIVLSELKKNTNALTPEYIKTRIARRFGIIGKTFNFSVFVNGEEVLITDRNYFHKLNYIWYYGEESNTYVNYAQNSKYNEKRDNSIQIGDKEYKVSGWIGTVESAGDLKEGNENLNKIVILVRGKLGQEDILSEYSEGGLYSKYLIGEINVDFFDDDKLEDMATSNRQEYQKDDERYIELKKFIYNELKEIERQWTNLRNDSGEKKALELLPSIKKWIDGLGADDKRYAKKMFGKVNQIIADDDKKKEIFKYSIIAFEKLRYSNRLSSLEKLDANNYETFSKVFSGLDSIEETLYYQIIDERITIIKKFQQITDEDENELERVIQKYLFDHLWLLDPSWERASSTAYMEKTIKKALKKECDKLTEEEKKARLDLGYRQTVGKHIIVELKRVKRTIKLGELVDQIKKYHGAIKKVLSENPNENQTFEILFVVGRPIDNDDSLENKEIIDKSLKPFNARIVYYSELLDNAFRAYNEYIRENDKIQPLVDVFGELDKEIDK